MKLWMAPAGLHIEPAQFSQAEALAKLHARYFFHGWSAIEFTDYANNPGVTPVYVACDKKQKIAGFMVLRLVRSECELLTIVVDKKFQRKGIARALMEAGFDDLLQTKVTTMHLEVDEANPPALALYARFGFVQTRTRPGYFPKKDGTRATALVMRRDFN